MPVPRWSLIKIANVDLSILQDYLSSNYVPLVARTPDYKESRGVFKYIQDYMHNDFMIQAENYYFINMLENDPHILSDFESYYYINDFQDIKNTYQNFSRGSKIGLHSAMQTLCANYAEYQDLHGTILVSDMTMRNFLICATSGTYQPIGLTDKTKHLIEYLKTKGLNEHIIGHCLGKKYTEYIDWKWQRVTFQLTDYPNYISDDLERQSYTALGGNPENYHEGCLDNYMDSIGL